MYKHLHKAGSSLGECNQGGINAVLLLNDFLLIRVIIVLQCPGMKELWKVMCLVTQLAASTSLGRSWLEMQKLESTPLLLTPNLHFDRIPGWFTHIFKVKICHPRSFSCFWAKLGTRDKLVSFSHFQVLNGVSCVSHWEERGNNAYLGKSCIT